MRFFLGFALLLVTACGQTTLIDPNAAVRDRFNLDRAVRFSVAGDAREYLEVRLLPEAASLDEAWADQYVLKAIAPGQTVVLPRSYEHREICEGSWCLNVVMPPGSLPSQTSEIQLEIPALHHSQRVELEDVRVRSWGLEVQPFEDNTKVLVSAQDPLQRTTRRSFFGPERELLLVPGLCSDSPAADDPGWTLSESFPAEIEPRFSDSIEMCVWMRPTAPVNGSPVAAASVSGRAIVRSFRHTFVPTPQRSPIVFGLLFDLEIPDPVRCRTAQDKLREQLRRTAEVEAEGPDYAVEVYELQPVQIAQDQGVLCRQADARTFDGRAVAESARMELEQRFGDTPIRITWIYVNNLNLSLPRSVSEGLSEVAGRSPFGGAPVFAFLSAVVADVPLADIAPDTSLRWVSADDPVFLQAVSGMAASVWPFTTLDHDPQAHVPLLTPEEGAEVEAFRVCNSGSVQASGIPLNTSIFRPGPLGPGFTATLPRSILVPDNVFIPEIVDIRWEACLSLCERSGPGQSNSSSWLESLGCP